MMDNSKYKAPAARKVLDILELMANENKSFTVSEISNKLDITSNSTFRIMVELESKGYVNKNIIDSSFQLTSRLYYLGNLIADRIALKSLAESSLKSLSTETKETTILAKFGEAYSTLIIDRVVSSEPIKFVPEIGHEYMSHASAMGKCMLAYIEPSKLEVFMQQNDFISLTQNTITIKDTFYRELEKIRTQAFAYDMEESSIGLRCIAAPIFSRSKEIEGCIAISGPTFRITDNQLKPYRDAVKKEAIYISKLLGYQGKEL